MAAPQLDHNAPNPRTRLRNAPAIDRLMFRTALMPDGCWQWRGTLNSKGYGNMRSDMDGPVVSVHRVSYEALVGPIPEGLEIDHLCFNRACVNPDHLEAITHAENVRRGRTNQNHGKGQCNQGHAFTAENTYTLNGKRACRECGKNRQRAYRARVAA